MLKLEASIGQIIFGGYDTEKISGSLYSLPMQPNEATNTISTMTIALTSLGFEKGGQVENLSGDAFPVPVLLDSGTTYLNVPQAVYSTMYSYFEVSQDSSGNHIVDCDLLSNANGSLNFGFGGTDGPLIKVPFSEFALPSNSAVNMTNGNAACQFGMGYSKDDQWILGDTFLRSAYVVYDLDNQIISLAQTNFNSTSTNVIEIGSDVVGTSISQGVTVHETATGVVGGDNHAPTGSVAASATGHFTVSGSIGEATGISATASSSNSPSAASSSATSSADNLTPFSSLKTMLCAVSLVSAVLSLL